MKKLIVLAAAALSIGARAQVYKWTDERGVTTYSSVPPSAGNGNTVKVDTPATGQKKPPEAEVGRWQRALMKLHPNAPVLDCAKAVDNAHGNIDSMLEIGAKNARGGYIDAAEHERTATLLKQARSKTSLTHCRSSSGIARDFYLCLSNPLNHVLACGKRYDH